MSRTAWSLSTTGASPEVYYFEVNPKADGGSFGVSKAPSYTALPQAEYSSKTLIFETVDDPKRVQYSGVLLSSAQYGALVNWHLKSEPVILTDDLGRSTLIYLDTLELTRAPKQNHPNRQEFSFSGYVLEVL